MSARPSQCDANQLRLFFEEALDEPGRRGMIAHLDDCRSCQADLEGLAAAGSWWDEVRRFAPGTSGDGPDDRRAEAVAAPPEFLGPPEVPGDLGRFGSFRILGVIGRGGMGIVFRAFDPALARPVALKVMAPHLAACPAARRRFIREARAAASVAHDHVVPIHAVDEVRGLPYILMQYVPGRSLQERIRQAGPLGLEEILQVGRQVASGLAAAHERGLIHRDIKPANILLEEGTGRAKLTDFGLALLGDEAPSIAPGDAAGTPEYMAPEQARGEAVDHRADLFSLGAVLYAMGTGESPFRAPTVPGVLRRVCDDDPRSARATNPGLPGWLDATIARLLAKDPALRPQTAAEVAALLERRGEGLPLPALGAPPARRVGRWGRAGAVLLGMALTGGLAVAAEVVIRVEVADGLLVIESDDPGVTVEVDGDDLTPGRSGPREVRLKVGGHLVRTIRPGEPPLDETVTIERGGRRLVRVRREPSGASKEPVAPRAPRAVPVVARPKRSLADLDAEVWTVAYSGDGRRLIWAGKSHDLLLSEPPDAPPRRIDAGEFGVQSLAFAPDGRTFAAGGLAGDVRVWDAATPKVIRTMELRADFQVFSVAFAPDGRSVAAGSRSGLIGIFDVATGEPRPAPPAQGRPITQVRYTPDGRTLIAATGDWDHPDEGGDVTLWEVGSNTFRGRLVGHKGRVAALAVSPDGQWIASGSNDGVRLWDAATLTLVAPLRVGDWQVNFLAFSPDGRTLASGQNRGQVTLWDVAARRPRATLAGRGGAISSVAFTPDGRELAMGGFDATLKVWDLADLPRLDEPSARPPAAAAADRLDVIVRPIRPDPVPGAPDR